MAEKITWRKAFNPDYLGTPDIDGTLDRTITHVTFEDHKDTRVGKVNVAHFQEKEIRPGEKMKPMILNVTNCKVLQKMTGSIYINDWLNIPVTIYIDPTAKLKGEVVGGLRIKEPTKKPEITPQNGKLWDRAKTAYLRDGDFTEVLKHAVISEDNQLLIVRECANAE